MRCFASAAAAKGSSIKRLALLCALLLAAPARAVAGGLDLNELLRQHGAAAKEPAPQQAAVLVSFSMPADSLRALAEQSGELGISMVLRGLADNSVTATAARIASADPEQRAAWEIDPRLFANFRIAAVPAVVVWRGEEALIARGEVGLDYALEQLGREPGELAAYARQLRQRLAAAP